MGAFIGINGAIDSPTDENLKIRQFFLQTDTPSAPDVKLFLVGLFGENLIEKMSKSGVSS